MRPGERRPTRPTTYELEPDTYLDITPVEYPFSAPTRPRDWLKDLAHGRVPRTRKPDPQTVWHLTLRTATTTRLLGVAEEPPNGHFRLGRFVAADLCALARRYLRFS